MKSTPEQIFWRFVVPKGIDECWEWSGCRKPTGYGQNKMTTEPRAHRMPWVIHRGPIPDGIHVCHRCDNPPCCNPNHLFLGTAKDNAQDREKKGRRPLIVGENFNGHKLTKEQVIQIRAMKSSGMSSAAIQREIGIVGLTQIKRIVNGKSRKHE